MTTRERHMIVSGVSGLVGKRTSWILIQLRNPRPERDEDIRYDLEVIANNVQPHMIHRVLTDCAHAVQASPGKNIPDTQINPEDN